MAFKAEIASVTPLLGGVLPVNFLDRVGGAVAIVNELGPLLFEASQAGTFCHEWPSPFGP